MQNKEGLKAKLIALRESCKFYIELYEFSQDQGNKTMCLQNIDYYQNEIEDVKTILLDCEDELEDTWKPKF